MVKTFSSFSPAQKLYPRQNWRLQSLHVFLEARGLSSAAGLLVVVGASRATIVLLPKQVHLQKDVGADDLSAHAPGQREVFREAYMLREM